MNDIKAFIRKKQLTQKAFAASIGVTDDYLSRVLKNKYPISTSILEINTSSHYNRFRS
jgi:transcriptional regulator with XRE-family HTH domain